MLQTLGDRVKPRSRRAPTRRQAARPYSSHAFPTAHIEPANKAIQDSRLVC